MKILTFGSSPYLLTSKSKIHADLLDSLSLQNDVSAIVLDHRTDYFLPEEDNKFYYNNIEIFPYELGNQEKLYKIIENIQPDLILTVCDYFEYEELCNIKQIEPNKFKWLAILISNYCPSQSKYRVLLEAPDRRVTTNYYLSKHLSLSTDLPCDYICSGYDSDIFTNSYRVENSRFSILSILKNCQNSNLGSLFESLYIVKNQYKVEFDFYLHTNIDDQGDYDIQELISQHHLEDVVHIPEKYTSVFKGCSDEQIRDLYLSSDVFLDPSLTHTTGMTVLESIACGCVPIFTHDVFNICFETDFDLLIPSNSFIGYRHQKVQIMSVEECAKKISWLYELWRNNTLKYYNKTNLEKIKRNDRETFVKDIRKICDNTYREKNNILILDNLS